MKNDILITVNGLVDKNNLPISIRGTTAYRGVRFGINDGRLKKPQASYFAIIGLSEEEQRISGKRTPMWYLSIHKGGLEPAYRVMEWEKIEVKMC